VRCGETKWHAEGKLVGQRDLPLSSVGLRQAKGVDAILGPVEVQDFLSSPLSRARETAEIIARHQEVDPGRDPRLTNIHVGPWEGMRLADMEREPAFGELLGGTAARFPDGEDLEDARTRVVHSVEQAIGDNQSGANIVMVTHCAPIQLILTHYLGMPVGHYRRLVLNPGSVSTLCIDPELGRPSVLGINWTSTVEVMVNVEQL
jgi:broad specificity phosphatase PhoE